MTTAQLRVSLDTLSADIMNTAETHMKAKGLPFDRKQFSEEVGPFVELVSQTAHFVASDVGAILVPEDGPDVF